MTIRIDKEHNIVRILIRDTPIVDGDETDKGVIYDFDENRHVVGLEFLNASDTLGDLSGLEDSLKSDFSRRKSSTTLEQHEYVASIG